MPQDAVHSSKARTPLLSTIAVSLKVEPQLEDVVLELAAEPTLVRILPFPVDNLEGNVLQHKYEHGWIRTVPKRSMFIYPPHPAP